MGEHKEVISVDGVFLFKDHNEKNGSRMSLEQEEDTDDELRFFGLVSGSIFINVEDVDDMILLLTKFKENDYKFDK